MFLLTRWIPTTVNRRQFQMSPDTKLQALPVDVVGIAAHGFLF